MLRFQVPVAASTLPPILKQLDRAGIDPIGVETARPTLDDVFLNLTGRSLRDLDHAPRHTGHLPPLDDHVAAETRPGSSSA